MVTDGVQGDKPAEFYKEKEKRLMINNSFLTSERGEIDNYLHLKSIEMGLAKAIGFEVIEDRGDIKYVATEDLNKRIDEVLVASGIVKKSKNQTYLPVSFDGFLRERDEVTKDERVYPATTSFRLKLKAGYDTKDKVYLPDDIWTEVYKEDTSGEDEGSLVQMNVRKFDDFNKAVSRGDLVTFYIDISSFNLIQEGTKDPIIRITTPLSVKQVNILDKLDRNTPKGPLQREGENKAVKLKVVKEKKEKSPVSKKDRAESDDDSEVDVKKKKRVDKRSKREEDADEDEEETKEDVKSKKSSKKRQREESETEEESDDGKRKKDGKKRKVAQESDDDSSEKETRKKSSKKASKSISPVYDDE